MNPDVIFYDVDPQGWDARVFKLAAAAWERNSTKLLILVEGDERAEALDTFLWTHREEVFLPHEWVRPGQELQDAEARVLITTEEANPHGARLLVLDRPASLEFAATFDVVMDVVDRRSEERLSASRERFKAWRDRGVTPAHKKA